MSRIDLEVAVVAGWLVLIAGGLLIVALSALSRRGDRVGSTGVRVSDGVLAGLGFLLEVPGGIVAGFGHYILDANTGAYGTLGDFRNSATFVDICWFFILVAAPASALVGTGLLASAAFRRGRSNRHR